MRPGPNLNIEAMARVQQGGTKMPGGNWQTGPQGQPMIQQHSQGPPPPMGTPGQRSVMAPPQAPPTGSANANRTQPSSPQPSQAPPTPLQATKQAPKKGKSKDESRGKVGTLECPATPGKHLLIYTQRLKKNSTTNAPTSSEPDRVPTPTPPTPNTPVHQNTFGGPGKGALATTAGGAANSNPAPTSNPSIPQNQQQIQPPDPMPGAGQFIDTNFPEQPFDLDFTRLDPTSDVLNDFDFDSFLNNSDDAGNWAQLDPSLGSEPFGMEPTGVE